MPDRLPLFPLGLVLFPGLVLPLHVFEQRYRVLVAELLERPEPERRFGVVAIRSGSEVGEDGVRALHDVGCVAQLRRAEPYDDGRFDVVTTGAERFRLAGLVDAGTPYVMGEVEWLPEQGPEDVAGLDLGVRAAFSDYLAALGRAQGSELDVPELPADPLVLSYAVAATVVVDLEERQALLAATDAPARLRAEVSLLRRETRLLERLVSRPAPDLARTPVNPN